MSEGKKEEQSSKLVEGKDYTLDERGYFVFTADYLKRRGYCCGSGCRNCPYQPSTSRPSAASS